MIDMMSTSKCNNPFNYPFGMEFLIHYLYEQSMVIYNHSAEGIKLLATLN